MQNGSLITYNPDLGRFAEADAASKVYGIFVDSLSHSLKPPLSIKMDEEKWFLNADGDYFNPGQILKIDPSIAVSWRWAVGSTGIKVIAGEDSTEVSVWGGKNFLKRNSPGDDYLPTVHDFFNPKDE